MKYLIYLMMVMLLVGSVSAISMTREAPTTSDIGTFTVRYVLDSTEDTFWSVEDIITGPCTPNTKKLAEAYMVGDQVYKETTYTASTDGTCTFNGVMTYSTATLLAETYTIPATTVVIGDGICEPSCTGKVCGDDGCGGDCGSCDNNLTCSNFQCVEEIDCTTQSDCNTGFSCINNACVADDTEPEPTCKSWEEDKDGKCSLKTSYLLIGVVGIVVFINRKKIFKKLK